MRKLKFITPIRIIPSSGNPETGMIEFSEETAKRLLTYREKRADESDAFLQKIAETFTLFEGYPSNEPWNLNSVSEDADLNTLIRSITCDWKRVDCEGAYVHLDKKGITFTNFERRTSRINTAFLTWESLEQAGKVTSTKTV